MNFLSKNLRYLRKTRRLSQEELARLLGVKRSSIAAYESKNVRPRLDFIVGLAKLFNIRISDLIERDIEEAGGPEKFNADRAAAGGATRNGHATENESPAGTGKEPPVLISPLRLDIEDEESVRLFMDRSVKIRKMLEGFKAFYRFKLESFDPLSGDAQRLTADIENFLLLMEHLLAHNEAVIRAISEKSDAE